MEDFEEAVVKMHHNPITFEQYEKQDDYGTQYPQYMRKSTIFGDDDDDEKKQPDAVDELKLFSAINKFRMSRNKKRVQAHTSNNDPDVEEEIASLSQKFYGELRKENVTIKWSKVKSGGKIPVVGKKNEYLTHDFFKFKSPSEPALQSNTLSKTEEQKN